MHVTNKEGFRIFYLAMILMILARNNLITAPYRLHLVLLHSRRNKPIFFAKINIPRLLRVTERM